MRIGSRAVAAVGLLVGFYVLVVGVIAGLVVLDVVAVRGGVYTAVLFSAPVIIALLRGLFTLGRLEKDDERTWPGVPVSPREQPRLWALVVDVAAETGTRPPDEIRLVPAVNAAVAEQTRLLGLRSGSRRLLIGIPLLAGLTQGQLAAVIAHEMGHYGNGDTRLGPITYRGLADPADRAPPEHPTPA
jgi:Zn-dependent protease with chaperone function